MKRLQTNLRRCLVLLLLCALCVFVVNSAAWAQAPVSEPLRTAGDRPIDIQHIRLDLKVDLPKKTVDARATLNIRSLRPISGISLDAVDFEVRKVNIASNGGTATAATFSHDRGKLIIDLDPAWPADRAAVLRIDYRIREPRDGLFFFGPTKEEPDVPLTVWSQGEPTTNRYWFPCMDQPNQKQTTELVVTVADGFEVLSNGKLVECKVNPDKTVTCHWREDKPHVAYLVTLVVGQFDIVREDWKGIPVLYYVPKGHKDDIARTFGRTREMLTFFSKRFGIDYPWEKYAQVVVEQFTAGGMENTSATTLTEFALHDQRSMLDSSPDGLIAHELAHQWWGDLVTCRDWSHIWLNEGFASFAEVLWAEHHDGPDEAAYNLLQKARGAIAGGKDRPMVDRRYAAPWAMFDARAYPKGAWVLHMLRRQLGEDVFWKCIQRFGTEHKFQCADTADFRKTLERVTGRSLERFFYDWTERHGNPVLEISTEYLPDTKQARVAVKQAQAGEAFHFPLKMVFCCPEKGSDPPNGQRGLTPFRVVFEQEITDKDRVFFVPLPGRPTRVEVDPDQAVLAEIKETKGRELWLAQLQESPGVAARIRAAQHFGQLKAPAEREALAKAILSEKFWGVQLEIAAALGESGGDACRDALIQGLKHSHPKVRRACADQLGKFRRDAKVAASLREALQKGDPSYYVESAALSAYARLAQPDTIAVLMPWLAKPSHREVLRTASLHGLAESQDLSVLDTLSAWTQRGKPRPCRIAALQAVSRLAQTANPSDEQRQQIVKIAAACLENEGPRVRGAAISVLRDLGRSASTTLAALEAIQRHDPSDRLRDLAKRATDQIRSNTPAPVELARLREELDRLKKANEELKERLNKVENFERKGSKAAALSGE